MTLIRSAFLRGALFKAMILGSAAMTLSTLIWSAALAKAIAVGLSLAMGNIALMHVLLRRLVSGPGRGAGAAALGALFLLKLLVLFGVTYYVIAVVGLDPLGFAAGYALLLAAIVWQSLTPAPTDHSSSP